MSGDGQQLCVIGQSSGGTPENVAGRFTVVRVEKTGDKSDVTDGAMVTAEGTEQIVAAAIDILGSHIPIIEVAFKGGNWWTLPKELSAELYVIYKEGKDAEYTWDWGPDGRDGSYVVDGVHTKQSRYSINFDDHSGHTQVNIDNSRTRSVRIVWVDPQHVEPRFTGGFTGGTRKRPLQDMDQGDCPKRTR